MRIARGVFPALCLAGFLTLTGCASEDVSDHFTLPNGISVPLHEAAKVQSACTVLGTRLPPNEDRICPQFPMDALRDGPDPLNWYGRILSQKGFEAASGAANQYWLNWPTEGGCYLRLNMTAVPKEYIQGDDWSEMKTYVAVFEFEDDERCD